MFDVVGPFLHNSNQKIQLAAVKSLGYVIANQTIISLLIPLLRTDPSSNVRIAILQSLLPAAGGEENDLMGNPIQRNTAYLYIPSESIPILEQVANHDPNSLCRGLANQVLNLLQLHRRDLNIAKRDGTPIYWLDW